MHGVPVLHECTSYSFLSQLLKALHSLSCGHTTGRQCQRHEHQRLSLWLNEPSLRWDWIYALVGLQCTHFTERSITRLNQITELEILEWNTEKPERD